MFLQILSSALFLPFLVTSMIIAQIHLEKYWDANISRRRESYWLVFYIVFIYIAQEIRIMELTLQNINTMAFTIVIPITMILRNKHKIWWALLLLTPLISAIMDGFLKRYQFINCNATFIQMALTIALYATLLHFKKLPYYITYTIALYCNGLIHILRLSMEHQLKLSFVITILLGNCFIILAENSRRYYELKQEEEIAKLHYESIRDDLTGLLNYRAFDRT